MSIVLRLKNPDLKVQSDSVLACVFPLSHISYIGDLSAHSDLGLSSWKHPGFLGSALRVMTVSQTMGC